jgi:DNA repair ATPase RecN
MASALPEEVAAAFKEVTTKTYKEQAIFFLNAYWDEHNADGEKMWDQVKLMEELDAGNNGSDLDEMKSHIYLEKQGESMTVLQLRQKLRKMDLDFNKRMAMIEFLLFKYDEDVKELIKRPQGTNEELTKAVKALDSVQVMIDAIEKEKNELEEKAAAGGVKGMRAKNELEQLLTRDNTAMNKALLEAEACVRKCKKAGADAPKGALWWVEREIEEVRRYKPQKQGGGMR